MLQIRDHFCGDRPSCNVVYGLSPFHHPGCLEFPDLIVGGLSDLSF